MKKSTAIAWAAGIAATFIGFFPQRAIAQMQPTCTFRQDVALSFPSRESVLCWSDIEQNFYMNVRNESITEFKISLASDRAGGTTLYASQYFGSGDIGQSYVSINNGVLTSGGNELVHLAALPWIDLFLYAVQRPTH